MCSLVHNKSTAETIILSVLFNIGFMDRIVEKVKNGAQAVDEYVLADMGNCLR